MAALSAAHPAMALLCDLSDTVEAVLQQRDSADLGGLRQGIRESLNLWSRYLVQSREQVAANAVRFLPRRGSFLLLSHSGTVLAACRSLARRRRLPVVVCESRPVREGTLMARDLAKAGCQVTVIADAAAGWWIDRVAAVVLGADWIDRRGFVNKTGSQMLSRLAAQASIPVFVLADSARIRNRVFREDNLPDHDPTEILARPRHGLRGENRYFERVEWDEPHRLILESGLISAPVHQWQAVAATRTRRPGMLGSP